MFELDWNHICESAPSGWSSVRLGHFFSERREQGLTELPLMSVTKTGWISQEDTNRRDTSNSDKSRYKVVREGDIVYNTMRMWQGRSTLASCDGLVSPAYTVLKPKPTIDVQYSAYLLRFPPLVRLFKAFSQGLTSDTWSLKFSAFSSLRIVAPPLPEQRMIAVILSSIDDTIQATQAVIDQTRQVKEGLLQDLLTKGIGHTRFKKTPIGNVPEGWEVVRLVEVLADGPRNGMYKPADQIGRGSLIVGQTAFTKDRMVDFSATRRAETTEDEVATYGLQKGDILVTRVYATSEGCGRPTLVGNVPEVAVYESNMMRLRPMPRVARPFFLFSWLRKPTVRRFLMARASSSNQTSINQKTLGSVPIALPPLPEQKKIATILSSVDDTIRDNEVRLQQLQQVKAGLLQDLLTGKVRVTV